MKRVLIAEDEASIREFIVINLQRSGYEVLEAENGAQAIALFDDCDGQIDVAILDIMMPEKDGMEVCRYFRDKSAEIGILMLSAKSQEIGTHKRSPSRAFVSAILPYSSTNGCCISGRSRWN